MFEEQVNKGLIVVQKEGDGTLSVIEKRFDVDATGASPEVVELEPRVIRQIEKDSLTKQKQQLEAQLEQVNFLLVKHDELPVPTPEEIAQRQTDVNK